LIGLLHLCGESFLEIYRDVFTLVSGVGDLTNNMYRGDATTFLCCTLFTKMWLSSVEENLIRYKVNTGVSQPNAGLK